MGLSKNQKTLKCCGIIDSNTVTAKQVTTKTTLLTANITPILNYRAACLKLKQRGRGEREGERERETGREGRGEREGGGGREREGESGRGGEVRERERERERGGGVRGGEVRERERGESHKERIAIPTFQRGENKYCGFEKMTIIDDRCIIPKSLFPIHPPSTYANCKYSQLESPHMRLVIYIHYSTLQYRWFIGDDDITAKLKVWRNRGKQLLNNPGP